MNLQEKNNAIEKIKNEECPNQVSDTSLSTFEEPYVWYIEDELLKARSELNSKGTE